MVYRWTSGCLDFLMSFHGIWWCYCWNRGIIEGLEGNRMSLRCSFVNIFYSVEYCSIRRHGLSMREIWCLTWCHRWYQGWNFSTTATADDVYIHSVIPFNRIGHSEDIFFEGDALRCHRSLLLLFSWSSPRGKCPNGLNLSAIFFIFSFNSTHTYGTRTLVKQLAVQHTKTQQMTAEKKCNSHSSCTYEF